MCSRLFLIMNTNIDRIPFEVNLPEPSATDGLLVKYFSYKADASH